MKNANFKVVVGDPYTDGHGMHETIYVKCNSSTDVIEEALSKAEAKLPWLKDICGDYQEDELKKCHVDELKALKVDIDAIEGCSASKDTLYLSPQGFVELHLEIAKKFSDNPLEYTVVNDVTPQLHLKASGYGLFST